MATLLWHQTGTRTYETGVSHGVFYPTTGPGVPWNGLISVNEAISGGEHEGLYFDGLKYAESMNREEFQAKIEAYSAPAGFASCEGRPIIAPGLFATNQKRTSFGMSYRTQIGNDIAGLDHGYKIHLIYGAFVAPTSMNYKTVGENIDPNIRQWDIYALPPETEHAIIPTAHWFIDAGYLDPSILTDLEEALYGTLSTDPYLPTLDQLVDLLQPTP